ncbi:MAG: hypothetical protein ACOC2H_10370 [Spirochaetota bacterium]
MGLFYCNTDFDAGMKMQIPRALHRTVGALSYLFVPLSVPDDTVLVSASCSKNYLAYLDNCGIQHGTVLLDDGFRDTGAGKYTVWGWDRRTYERFPHADERIDPDIVRRVNSREFSLALERTMSKRGPVPVSSVADCLRASESTGIPFVVKPVYGSSGRGFVLVENCEELPKKRALLERTLSCGGGTAERWHRRTGDFSFGKSVFHTEAKSPSIRRLENSRIGLFSHITVSDSCDVPLPDAVSRRTLADVYQTAADALHGAGYDGPFGIDGYVYEENGTPKVRYMCEINCRMTMADVAYGFLARYPAAYARIISVKSSVFNGKPTYRSCFGDDTFSADTGGAVILTPAFVEIDGAMHRAGRVFVLICADSITEIERIQQKYVYAL